MSKLVHQILAFEWDPLGTVVRGGFSDEYDSYALVIIDMLRRGKSGEAICAYLKAVESKRMLQEPNSQRADAVSKLIVSTNELIPRRKGGG